MSGVIKKLYHPTDGGTVTTLPDSSLQELFPIVSTTGVIAPEGAFHANDSLDQILRWLDANKISGTGLKTLTINGVEQSLIGSGTVVINSGGGGGSDSDFFELDASGNLHVKNDRGLYTGSFISAGGVGSGGGQGGDGNATSIMGYPIVVDSTHPLGGNAMLMYDIVNHIWEPVHPYRPVDIKKSDSSVVHVLDGYSVGTLFLKEGTGITLEVDTNNANTIIISSTGGSGNLPIASASQLGGIKVGSGLSINSSTGVLSCSVDLSNYVTNSSLSSTLSGYVTLNTQQTISGFKTFSNSSGIAIGSSSNTISYSNGEFVINGNVRVNGNFYATGAVTAGA